MQLCECGCGQPIPFYKDGRNCKYNKGHKSGTFKGTNILIPSKCDTCGKPITIEQWRTRFKHNYCSRTCSSIGTRRITTTPCDYCGKPVTYKSSRKQGKRVFCNQQCAKAAPSRPDGVGRTIVHCSYCQKELKVWPSKITTNEHFYCNKQCRAQYIQGTNNPSYTGGLGRQRKYGPHWRATRNAILQRDNHTCQYCKKRPLLSRRLHVHHIKPFYLFNDDWEAANQPYNLITLCHTCHKQAEKGLLVLQPRLL